MDIKRINIAELLRFGFVGVLNTLSALAVIYALMALGVGPYLANLGGYAVGLVISFTLNRRWTFRSTNLSGPGLVARFLIAVAVSYLVNLLTVYLCLHVGVPPHLAQLLGMPAYTLCFYVSSKLFVFREKPVEFARSGKSGAELHEC